MHGEWLNWNRWRQSWVWNSFSQLSFVPLEPDLHKIWQNWQEFKVSSHQSRKSFANPRSSTSQHGTSSCSCVWPSKNIFPLSSNCATSNDLSASCTSRSFSDFWRHFFGIHASQYNGGRFTQKKSSPLLIVGLVRSQFLVFRFRDDEMTLKYSEIINP